MGNFFDENTPSEYEMLSESLEEQTDAFLEEMEDEEYLEDDDLEYESEDSAYPLNNHEGEVLSQATIRLEQARLYEMLIKHDLFEGVEANASALANVQRELKEYIVGRLEILLGIRAEKIKDNAPRQVVVESDFNDVEVKALKAIAYKLTKGESSGLPNRKVVASEEADDEEQVVVKPRRKGLKPMSAKPKATTIKPVARKVVKKAPIVEEVEEEPIQVKQPVKRTRKKAAPKKAKKPTTKKATARKPAPKNIKSIKRKRRGEMTKAEAEQIAREELAQGSSLGKHPYEMNAKELAKHVKGRASSKKPKKRPANAAPIPTADALTMHYQTQQANSGMSNNTQEKLVSRLVQNAVKKANS